MDTFCDQIPDCPTLLAFVDELPDDISARLTRHPLIDGRFAAWLPMVFDCDEARAAAHALVRVGAVFDGDGDGVRKMPLGLEEYLALCLLALTLSEDHDDLRVDGLRRLIARDARAAKDGKVPFESEIRECALGDSEDGAELQRALDAFTESCASSGRTEVLFAAEQIVEALATEVGA